MTQVEQTPLPGIGIRHDFMTAAGTRVGVVTHRSGYRELVIYDRDDPDRCVQVVRLDDDDSHALVEMLGASRVTDALTTLHQSVEGLVIDWLPIEAASASVGKSIRDYGLRSETGVSIVAVLRGGETHPAPEADFVLDARDTVVVVGTASGIAQTVKLLRGH